MWSYLPNIVRMDRSLTETSSQISCFVSWKGHTIFEGIMNAKMYTDILAQCLVPFIQRKYPEGHRFMQDNDSKHTSHHACACILCRAHQLVENTPREHRWFQTWASPGIARVKFWSVVLIAYHYIVSRDGGGEPPDS